MIGKESVTGIGQGMISWLADGLKVEEVQWVGPIEIMFTFTELSILQTTIEGFCKDMWEIGYTDRKDRDSKTSGSVTRQGVGMEQPSTDLPRP